MLIKGYSLQEETVFEIGKFTILWNWFGQLEAEYVRDSLHPDNARASKEEDMDVMRQFITQSEGELTRGCLLVLHRIRNNLMHGMKLLEGLDGQIELFRAATAVLESIAG